MITIVNPKVSMIVVTLLTIPFQLSIPDNPKTPAKKFITVKDKSRFRGFISQSK